MPVSAHSVLSAFEYRAAKDAISSRHSAHVGGVREIAESIEKKVANRASKIFGTRYVELLLCLFFFYFPDKYCRAKKKRNIQAARIYSSRRIVRGARTVPAFTSALLIGMTLRLILSFGKYTTGHVRCAPSLFSLFFLFFSTYDSHR